MGLKIPKFKNKQEKFAFLKKNEKTLIKQKKAKLKRAKTNFNLRVIKVESSKTKAKKSQTNKQKEGQFVDVTAIISTTNIRDSHKDVHLKGWAKKSIKENKSIMHLQEHKSDEFSKIISEGEDLKVYTKDFTWKELGFDFEGKTEALVFESRVRKERNPEMYKQYKNEWVKNHSVGMSYVKIFLAMDSDNEDHKENKEKFDKYIDSIANKEEVVADGYFWGVVEAKVHEGSSVPAGSNFATPTQSVKQSKNKKKSKKQKMSKKMKALKKYLKKS